MFTLLLRALLHYCIRLGLVKRDYFGVMLHSLSMSITTPNSRPLSSFLPSEMGIRSITTHFSAIELHLLSISTRTYTDSVGAYVCKGMSGNLRMDLSIAR